MLPKEGYNCSVIKLIGRGNKDKGNEESPNEGFMFIKTDGYLD